MHTLYLRKLEAGQVISSSGLVNSRVHWHYHWTGILCLQHLFIVGA
jgi:hypothetical protein